MKKLSAFILGLFLTVPALADLIGETVKGTTDYSVELKIIDETTGIPSTDIVFNTTGIDLWYRRQGAASVDITEADLATPALTDAHADGGFLHINDGVYRLDLPDAAVATGADWVYVGGAVTGEIVIGGRVRLTDVAPFDPATDTVLVSSGTGAGQLDVTDGIVASDLQEIDTNAAAAGRLRQQIASYATGTVQSDSGTTITLDAGGSSQDNFYNGGLLLVYSGTGLGQAHRILDYVGSSKEATISEAFSTSLDATSNYLILPEGGVSVNAINGDVQSLADLKDFVDAGYDPATNKVQGVVLVDTTTTNTDMRGTDDAFLATNAPTNFPDLSISATTGLVDITQTAADKPWSSGSRSLTTLSGITDLGWNTSWDAEVESEVTDGINGLFTFTVAGNVDSNAQYWNDTQITTALQTTADIWDVACTSPTAGTVREQLCSDVDDILGDTNALETRLTAVRADYLDVLAVQDTALANCEVNTANFAGSTTTLACILTDRDGGAITQASGDLEGLQIVVTSGAQIREQRFIIDTTWDAGNSELQLTLSRALPGTLADAVTAVIR